MGYPVPTRVFLKLSLDTAMLFIGFGCAHLPSCRTIAAHTEPSAKDIARSDITR